MPDHPHHRRRRSRSPRFTRRVVAARRPRGVIIVIALISLLLIAGVFGFLLNSARQVNRRVDAQNVADATARSAAGWTARQMNTVAMNNVVMCRMIALIPVLDAMPMATQFTLEEQQMIVDAIDRQLASGVSDNPWLRDAMKQYRERIQREIDILQPMHDFMSSGTPVEDMVHYNGGSGAVWQALYAMDQYNQVTMENLGMLTQVNAVKGGQAAIRDDDYKATTFVVPVLPQVAYQRGRWDDFRQPVMEGLLPSGVDHKEFNRGPWDVVFGRRHLVGGQTHGYWIGSPGQQVRKIAKGGKGSVPIGRGAQGNKRVGGTSRWITTGRDPDTYGVWGDYEEMRRRIAEFHHHHLERSRFWGKWASPLIHYKMSYNWPGSGTKRIHDPEWTSDFDEAVRIADSNPSAIVETMFLGSELKSKYPMDHPSFLDPGTYAVIVKGDRENPFKVIVKDWMDPRKWEESETVTKVDDHIWRDQWSYEVYFDKEIGIHPTTDPDTGQQVPQPVYRIDDFVFLGVNTGRDVIVSNPFEGFDKGSADAPSPIDLDHTQVTRDEIGRRNNLTVLAVTAESDEPFVWVTKFDGNKPDSGSGRHGSIVAISQAHVFNNHSWDMWTQMWHAQLQRITHVDDWLTRMDEGSGTVGAVTEISATDYDHLRRYLRNLEPMLEENVKH